MEQPAPPAVYRKRWGFTPDPAVAREIARLDARADCQRIVHLLTAYEFPWDMTRALELALFYTYGSASVAALLDQTQEFARHGQKRYDDTRLLIAHLMESGWDGAVGRRALQRMNRSHGHYRGRIPNEDFLFVLWTFIDFPLRWTERYARRPMTAHERLAWWHFWTELGRRMGMRDIPVDKVAFDAFVDAYRQHQFEPADGAGQRVAAATLAVMQAWLPWLPRRWVTAAVMGFFADDPRFLRAIGVAPGTGAGWHPLTARALRLLGRVKRVWALGPYPHLADSARDRTYPDHRYEIEDLAPQALRQQAPSSPEPAADPATPADAG